MRDEKGEEPDGSIPDSATFGAPEAIAGATPVVLLMFGTLLVLAAIGGFTVIGWLA